MNEIMNLKKRIKNRLSGILSTKKYKLLFWDKNLVLMDKETRKIIIDYGEWKIFQNTMLFPSLDPLVYYFYGVIDCYEKHNEKKEE